ncbi:MAG: VWA domain-containing protein [Phycisphaerae bacterium]|nr:VWA domain-containing protein [Phycisphaerae bacterium]
MHRNPRNDLNPRLSVATLGVAVGGAVTVAVSLAVAPAVAGGDACRAAAAAEAASCQPTVDLAICLDTSGSMQGLIDTARARIWDVVSDLATAQPVPKLRVALITFGNDGHRAENGWTSVDSAFTDDLDTISMKLFALATNGGTEFVGRAVDTATRTLDWTPGDKSLKLIVIAGNESADQDAEVRYGDASRRAIEKGIMVNSIYCGDPADALAPAWREVAKLADGHYAAINQAEGAVAISTPFDDRLAALSSTLNETYLPYGAQAEWGAANQTRQDGNASGMSTAVAAQRCGAKASSLYNNRGWDLVDACKDASFKLESVKKDELPEAMQSMTPDERTAHVAAMAARRAEIQKQVQEIGLEREKFLNAERARLASESPRFEHVIRDAVRAQATAKGMNFPAPATAPAIAAPTEPAAPAAPLAGSIKDGC